MGNIVRHKLIRITTVPVSLKILLKGQHQFMSEYFDVVGIASSGKELQEVAQNEGIRVISVQMTRKITPFKDIKAVWGLYRILMKEKPSIVHTHTPKAGIVGMLAAKMAGVPIRLHTVAGLPLMEATGLKRKVLDFVEKLTYSSATKVYPNSKGLHNFILKNNYTSADKLKVIGQGSSNGIDTNFFSSEQISIEQQNQLKETLNINSNDFVFIFVGRLVSDKGINELVEAFKKINNNYTEVKLLLVGPLEAELDSLQKDTLEEIDNNLSIIGVGYQEDVRPYFAIADALVFPSYREGFPNVVMQAGAMGLPSIVSDINGCNEIVVENQNGIIIPVKDKEALYNAMRRFLDDTAFRDQLQQKARFMIKSRYEQRVVWEAILQEYKENENHV